MSGSGDCGVVPCQAVAVQLDTQPLNGSEGAKCSVLVYDLGERSGTVQRFEVIQF